MEKSDRLAKTASTCAAFVAGICVTLAALRFDNLSFDYYLKAKIVRQPTIFCFVMTSSPMVHRVRNLNFRHAWKMDRFAASSVLLWYAGSSLHANALISRSVCKTKHGCRDAIVTNFTRTKPCQTLFRMSCCTTFRRKNSDIYLKNFLILTRYRKTLYPSIFLQIISPFAYSFSIIPRRKLIEVL